MASPALIAIVCSDRHRNGKTLLARLLVDHLLLEERDPYCLDLSHPEGGQRAFFPGRTALVDFSTVPGQMKVFDTILSRPGRDYVIDVPAPLLARFCELALDLDVCEAAREKGFRIAVFYVVDKAQTSLRAAVAAEELLLPDLFVPVANRHVGSSLPKHLPGPAVYLERFDAALQEIIANRRFSLRAFLLGDEAAVPEELRANLRNFLDSAVAGLRDLEPAFSLRALRLGEVSQKLFEHGHGHR